MPLILVEGKRGSGKTLFCTIMALTFSKRDFYSNFKIKSDRYHPFKLVHLLFIPDHVELIMDEGYSMIDSRLSGSYVNIFSGYICYQLRKTDRNIFITTIKVHSIEKRYREEWDYYVHCERIQNDSEDWREWDYLYTILDDRRGNISQWLLNYENAKKYFDKYDTFEIIPPRNKTRIEYELLKDEQNFLIKRAKMFVRMIEKNLEGNNNITKEMVEIALLNNEIDSVWTKICYLILKKKVK